MSDPIKKWDEIYDLLSDFEGYFMHGSAVHPDSISGDENGRTMRERVTEALTSMRVVRSAMEVSR